MSDSKNSLSHARTEIDLDAMDEELWKMYPIGVADQFAALIAELRVSRRVLEYAQHRSSCNRLIAPGVLSRSKYCDCGLDATLDALNRE